MFQMKSLIVPNILLVDERGVHWNFFEISIEENKIREFRSIEHSFFINKKHWNPIMDWLEYCWKYECCWLKDKCQHKGHR